MSFLRAIFREIARALRSEIVKGILGIILSILGAVAGAVTPQLRDLAKTHVAEWEAAAKKSANPFDDILVGIVKGLLGL